MDGCLGKRAGWLNKTDEYLVSTPRDGWLGRGMGVKVRVMIAL